MKTTFDDVATKYAVKIRQSADSVMVKTAFVQTVPSEFFSVIKAIVKDLDTWEDEHGRQLEPSALRQLCLGVDRELELDDDTLWEIKKGSIRSLAVYENLTLQMFYRLKSR